MERDILNYHSPFGDHVYHCVLKRSYYAHGGRVRLDLIDIEDYSPVATVTVNIPEEPLEKDQIIVKNYSENDGMMDFLINNKIVSAKDTEMVRVGYVNAVKCKLIYKFE